MHPREVERPHENEVIPTANKSRALETFFFEEHYMYGSDIHLEYVLLNNM